MLACANTSNRHNAIFGTDDLNRGMLKGAVMDSSVGGCANAIKRKDCNTPSDRWYASAIKGIEQDTVQHMFEDKVAVQLDTLKKLGKFPKKGLDIAIDMHLILCSSSVHILNFKTVSVCNSQAKYHDLSQI